MRGPEDRVVEHVLADAWEVGEAGDSELGEVVAEADPGDHEELRRLQGTRGEDDFVASVEGEVDGWCAECASCCDLDSCCGFVRVE